MEKWEMNRGMGLSFGYNAIEEDDKIMSVEDTISLLVSTVSNNGNLLLNIGPKADGTIPKEQEKRLLSIGQWLAVNGEAIYGTRCSKRESAIDESGVQIHYTKKKKDLYVMLDKVPQGAFEVVIPDLSGEIRALDDKIFYDFEAFGTGVKIKIHSHQTSIGSIAFKVPGGE
jgi:alpha-L-fucosidase